ncbi:MAG: hypothetical protein ACQEQF_03755 [Bacillota bacterium]
MKIDEFLHKIKINNFQSIEKILEQSNNNLDKQNTEKNFNKNKNMAELNINKNIIKLLDNLNNEEKKLLLNTLLKLELPFNEKNLRFLINLMNNKEVNIKNDSLIKAMGILQKSGLALNYNLIEGISQNLDSSTSQTDKLVDIMNNNNLINILNNLFIDPSQEKNELTDQLKNYLSNLKNLETILVNNQNKSEKENELFRQLLGQKIINKEKSNILLSLEIPINWPKNNYKTPLYLEILKENNNKNKKDKNNEYKIAFNIDLNKRGLIYAYLKIKNKNIKAFFKSDNEKTLKIIENKKDKLKESIQNIGYNLSLKVKSEEKKVLREKNSLEFFLEENNELTKNENYQHIDIKI